MTTIDVNGTTLYYERRGKGPSVLFIAGATGDAGHFGAVAEALADEFTVVTYDRRGNSRSTGSPNQGGASVDEQADDVAALLTALGLAPAVVYGSSSGAIYLTSLALRRPDVLRGAIFHEPPYVAVTSQPEAVGAGFEAAIGEGMARGGGPVAVECFLRWACGNEAFETLESLDAELVTRCVGNGEAFFGTELPGLATYLPDPAELGAMRVPSVVTAGAEHADRARDGYWYHEAAEWLATQLGTPLVETPGGHIPQATHPEALLAWLRPVLRELSNSLKRH
jgi:pimeloyl-ACP methyl ester carboxylesterase